MDNEFVAKITTYSYSAMDRYQIIKSNIYYRHRQKNTKGNIIMITISNIFITNYFIFIPPSKTKSNRPFKINSNWNTLQKIQYNKTKQQKQKNIKTEIVKCNISKNYKHSNHIAHRFIVI